MGIYLRSELEIKKDEIEVGTQIVYSDMSNYMTYTVLETNGTTITVENNESGYVETHHYARLQMGWEVKK